MLIHLAELESANARAEMPFAELDNTLTDPASFGWRCFPKPDTLIIHIYLDRLAARLSHERGRQVDRDDAIRELECSGFVRRPDGLWACEATRLDWLRCSEFRIEGRT